MTTASSKISFDHLILRVSSFIEAESFYQKLFTYVDWLKVVDPQDEKIIGFKQSDGLTIWIEEVQDSTFGKTNGWLDHFAFSCESPAEVDQAYQFCLSQNWKIITEPKAYPEYGDFYGFSFSGPDDLKLEFVCH